MSTPSPLRPQDVAFLPSLKPFSNSRAYAALKSAVLVRLEDEAGELFVVSWNAQTREFRDLGDGDGFVASLARPGVHP